MSATRSPFLQPKLLVLVAVGLALALLVPVLGAVMHDNDQASLIDGAVQLAAGTASPWAADFYNYDKQFASYWLLALLRLLLPAADPVACGNVLSFSVFWSGVIAALGAGRVRSFLQAAALVACLLAPAFVLHSPFLGTSSLSAGFLLWAWALWPRHGNRLRLAGAVALVALATGCRADVVLVLPWFAWTLAPSRPLRSWLARPGLYLLAGTGLAAIVAGREIFRGATLETNAFFFYPKIYAAFVVFGLGAASGVLLWGGGALLAVTRRRFRQRRPARLFPLLGLLGLLVPFVFYSLQLFTTRYWTLVLLALLIGLLSPRGRVLFPPARGRNRVRLASGLLLAGAIVPVVVGLQLPFPNRPRVVLAEPTLFPTADGLQPMGAMASFLGHIAQTPEHVADHNQGIWLAATRADLQPDASGRVPILISPLRSYLLLTATLRRLPAYLVSDQAPIFYTDARDLLRVIATADRFRLDDRRELAARLDVHPAGPSVAGYSIVRAVPGQPANAAWHEALTLAHAVRGNEYRVRPEYRGKPRFVPPRRDEGRTILLFSRQPFSAALEFPDGSRQPLAPVPAGDPALHLAVVPGRAWAGATFVVSAGDPAVAITVFPDYMSIDRM